jgi:hypothetical protein
MDFCNNVRLAVSAFGFSWVAFEFCAKEVRKGFRVLYGNVGEIAWGERSVIDIFVVLIGFNFDFELAFFLLLGCYDFRLLSFGILQLFSHFRVKFNNKKLIDGLIFFIKLIRYFSASLQIFFIHFYKLINAAYKSNEAQYDLFDIQRT